ncbi:MAG: GYD domain-containing protein [Candidatus Omnitrophica bacterium]|nr:GYD domain-containing protein [Candidatus Omnitrophota bacterium]
MSMFLMFGKYSSESLKEITGERTKKALDLIKKFGGEVNSMYALLGGYDLLLIVNFSDIEQVMKASVALYRLTGISFTTSPAVAVDEFDKMMTEM